MFAPPPPPPLLAWTEVDAAVPGVAALDSFSDAGAARIDVRKKPPPPLPSASAGAVEMKRIDVEAGASSVLISSSAAAAAAAATAVDGRAEELKANAASHAAVSPAVLGRPWLWELLVLGGSLALFLGGPPPIHRPVLALKRGSSGTVSDCRVVVSRRMLRLAMLSRYLG